jgi:hypothetical protein
MKNGARIKKTRKSKTNVEGRKQHFARHHQDLHHDVKYTHKHLDKLWEHVAVTNSRLYNLEAQVNLVSRLVTTMCIEKFGMKLKTFRRLIQRIEKEAIADSEIRDLQDLFELEVGESEDSSQDTFRDQR